MSTFSTNTTLACPPSLIPSITKAICDHFIEEGYQVTTDEGYTGGRDISITKGGTFKALLGLRNALNISLRPAGDNTYFQAGAGIYGMHAIPTAITLLACWPVLFTQTWGLIQQAHLDDQALQIALSALNDVKYHCTNCGKLIAGDSLYCPHCGTKIERDHEPNY